MIHNLKSESEYLITQLSTNAINRLISEKEILFSYRKLVTITLGTMSKFGFFPYGTNTIETIINFDV
ncbi:hypothetical protein BpHYR1_003695 [Brachionus plicatilis]|uniref:Uncharacterized protein n=1 Tax=Brachionus plicatilis TaxID=10195 RepID=A0A3M7QWW8_BRAPC|nr:hypothetical protein BpHYR1_003695 [Brachionus plicatilis]